MKGPTQIVIPEQKYLSCQGCEFFSYMMLKSGFNPIYAHFCENPDIPKPIIRMSPLPKTGNLVDDKTPEWCPFLTNKVEEL